MTWLSDFASYSYMVRPSATVIYMRAYTILVREVWPFGKRHSLHTPEYAVVVLSGEASLDLICVTYQHSYLISRPQCSSSNR